jgi:hypothetical protein
VRDLAQLGALIAAGVVPLLAYGALGLAVVRILRLRAGTGETLALAFVFGTGASSLAILGLRLADLPLPLWALAGVALAGIPLARGLAPRPGTGTRAGGAWIRALEWTGAALAALTFAAALGPETYWDGFEYHLPMVAAWVEGPIRGLPGMLDAELRAGVDLLYVPALTAGQPDAAAGVSAGFAVALAVLIRAEATRRSAPGAAAVAAFFALVVPFTRDNAPSTYVDLGVGAYGFLALAFADRWNRCGGGRHLTAAALCLAFAANAKLHAAILVPAVGLLVMIGGRPPGPRRLLGAAALVAAVTLPWFAKAWLSTGNPLFPLLSGWLGSGPASEAHLSLRRFRLSTDFPGARSPAGFLHYLGSLLMGWNPHLSGLLGPLPFALLPAAVHRMQRPTAVLCGVLFVLFVLQFAFMPALRFGTPLLPFVAIATAVGGSRLARSAPWAARALGLVVALLAIHHVTTLAASYLPRIAALTDPRAYVQRTFPDQVALGELVARGRGVVAIPKGAVLWMPRPVYVLHWERNGELFFDRVLEHQTPPDEALTLLRERGVGSLVLELPRARIGRSHTGQPTVDAWIVRNQARVRLDVRPLRARGDRVFVLIDLL